MSQVEQISIFLASPGDVRKERDLVEDVVAELNRTTASPKGMDLRVVRWEEDAYPSYGQDPQAIINAQIAQMTSYDLFVGILWNRIGTPTPRAASGTVEELEIATQALARSGKPDIWLYFRDASARLDTNEQIEQRKQVIEFRRKAEQNGLTWTYKKPSDFCEKFRSQLTLWLGKRSQATASSPGEHLSAGAQPQASLPRIASDTVRVNGYKLFYFRTNHKLTFTGLAQATGVDRSLLRKLERVNQEKEVLEPSCFNSCERSVLDRLEEALACPGSLEAGKADDFLAQYMQFYRMYKGATVSNQRSSDKLPQDFVTKAVVFDFDGTLTQTLDNRTTWEKIWVSLGYSINDCADLHKRFQRKEFTHQQWCDLTRDAFRTKNLTMAQLERIAQETPLVDGVRETVGLLRQRGVRLFILSGSIKSIIRCVLGDLQTEFEEIKANEVVFDPSGIISDIQGTPYDFKGKAAFLERVLEDWQFEPSDVLFVGNSCNDVFAIQSGVRTLCVNPRFTDPDNEEHWTYAIREMANLQEIMTFVKL
jgi:HAD superfamily phosphoserine phosphatase-like hydrolase